jgi:hypothetical protein
MVENKNEQPNPEGAFLRKDTDECPRQKNISTPKGWYYGSKQCKSEQNPEGVTLR